jgi:hypothetical protein
MANPLGVLKGGGCDLSGLLYNNYIPAIHHLAGNGHLGYSVVPVFQLAAESQFCKEKIDLRGGQVAIVKEYLEKGRYLTVTLNARHLSNVPFDREWYHDWFIRGYDDETQSFFAVGFVVDTSCHALTYQHVEIGYADFLKALPPPDKKTDYADTVSWLPESYTPPEINLRKIKRGLLFYAYPPFPLFLTYNAYRTYALMVRLRHKNNENPFDLRGLRMIFEHKGIVRSMIADLVNDKHIAEAYEEVYNLANMILITALKYNIVKSGKETYLASVLDTFRDLRKKERAVMRELYKYMRKKKDVDLK